MVWDRGRSARKKSRIGAMGSYPRCHYKRTAALLHLRTPDNTPSVVLARVVLNDVNQKGILLFSSVPLSMEQKVEVVLQDPHPFSATGTVRSCQQMAFDQRIISDHQFQYRVSVEFDVHTAEDRDRIDAYCNVIQGSCLRVA
jgi:hypothetical protein